VERAEFIAAAALLLAAPPPGDARRAPRRGHWLDGLAYQLKRPVAQRPALAPLRAACVQSGDWSVLRSALFPTPAARARAAAEARAFLRLPAAPPSAAPPPYENAPPEFVAAMCERFAALPPAALAKVCSEANDFPCRCEAPPNPRRPARWPSPGLLLPSQPPACSCRRALRRLTKLPFESFTPIMVHALARGAARQALTSKRAPGTRRTAKRTSRGSRPTCIERARARCMRRRRRRRWRWSWRCPSMRG